MKKLLAILAVSTLTVSSASLLVSCTTDLERQSKLQYDIDTLKKIIFEITGEDINVNVGDYLTESEVNEIIQSTLDSTLGLQSAFDTTNLNLKQLKNADDGTTPFVEYDKIGTYKSNSYELLSNSIAQKKLFNEYTTSLSNNESFDFQKLMDGFALNVINTTSVSNFEGNDFIDVNPGDQIWFTNLNTEVSNARASFDTLWATSIEPEIGASKIGVPEIQTLTKEFEGETKSPQFAIKKSANDEGTPISAQTALSLRFQDYYENQLKADIISDVMVMSNINSKLFSYRGENAYINPTNSFTNKLQDFNDSSTDWTTNVRMVWTIKYKKLTDDKQNSDLWNKINDLNTGFKSGGTISEAFTSLISDDEAPLKDNLILEDSSYDSYFGLSGYQGIKFDGFGEDFTSDKAWSEPVNSQQDGPLIVANTSTQPGFDVENPNYNEVAIVLPIYFIELMAGSKSVASDDVSTVYSLFDSEKNSKKIKLGRAGVPNNEEDILIKWHSFVNTKGSVDVRNTLAENENRENLLNELLFMACADTTFVDAAKRDIYTKYLDKETIYYSGIWDMVKKYIEDEEDEDM